MEKETGVKILVRGQELPAWMIQALQAGHLRFDKDGRLRGTRRSLPPILRALDDWQAQTAQKEKKMELTVNTTAKNGKKPENTTWLTRIGYAYGKPADELQVGDVIGHDCDGFSKVLGFGKETGAYLTVILEGEGYPTGTIIYERKFKKNRIVAIAGYWARRK